MRIPRAIKIRPAPIPAPPPILARFRMVALILGMPGIRWRVTELVRRAGRAEWEAVRVHTVRRRPDGRDGMPTGEHPPEGAVRQNATARNVERPRDQALRQMRPVPRPGRIAGRPAGGLLLSDARRSVVDYWRMLPTR